MFLWQFLAADWASRLAFALLFANQFAAPLGTDEHKVFLETAPALIVGYPTSDVRVPAQALRKKALEDIVTFV